MFFLKAHQILKYLAGKSPDFKVPLHLQTKSYVACGWKMDKTIKI